MNWEYKTIEAKAGSKFGFKGNWLPESFDRQLNDLGKQGWELVSVYQSRQHRGTTQSIAATLKRPLP